MHDSIVSKLTGLKREQKSSLWDKFAKGSLIALFYVIVIVVLSKFDLSELEAVIKQNPDLAFIIGLLVIFLTGVTLIPTIPFTIVISVITGPFLATLITTLATTLTALVHYQIGKQIGDVLNFERKKARLPFKLGQLPVNSPLFLLIGRAIPGGPTGLSFVCGAYSVPYFVYLWTTVITNLLGSALIAYGCYNLIRL